MARMVSPIAGPRPRAGAATHHFVQALKSMPVWACAQRMAVRTSTCGSPLGSRPSREGDHSPPTRTASSSFRPSKNYKKKSGIRNETPITWVSPGRQPATTRAHRQPGVVKSPHGSVWGGEGSPLMNRNQPRNLLTSKNISEPCCAPGKRRGNFSSETVSMSS